MLQEVARDHEGLSLTERVIVDRRTAPVGKTSKDSKNDYQQKEEQMLALGRGDRSRLGGFVLGCRRRPGDFARSPHRGIPDEIWRPSARAPRRTTPMPLPNEKGLPRKP